VVIGRVPANESKGCKINPGLTRLPASAAGPPAEGCISVRRRCQAQKKEKSVHPRSHPFSNIFTGSVGARGPGAAVFVEHSVVANLEAGAAGAGGAGTGEWRPHVRGVGRKLWVGGSSAKARAKSFNPSREHWSVRIDRSCGGDDPRRNVSPAKGKDYGGREGRGLSVTDPQF